MDNADKSSGETKSSPSKLMNNMAIRPLVTELNKHIHDLRHRKGQLYLTDEVRAVLFWA